MAQPQLVSIGDLDGDGQVSNSDVQGLIIYLANGGAPAGSLTAVPEPSGLLLNSTALCFLGAYLARWTAAKGSILRLRPR
jgi:hypothetical protein